MHDLVTKAEVTFIVPSVGPHIEVYSMDDENDQFCWLANERITGAIISHIRPVEWRSVGDEEFAKIRNARDAMMARVRKRLNEQRRARAA